VGSCVPLLLHLVDQRINLATYVIIQGAPHVVAAGAMRKNRGVKRIADAEFFIAEAGHCRVEGRCRAEREEREVLLQSGAAWREARSANAGMVVLAGSGVKLRKKIVNAGGTVERWRKPR
jgi:hypothetical protein